MKIKTSWIWPPIPMRPMDWCAYIDGQEEGPKAWGKTEKEAKEHLLELIAEKNQ